MSLPMHELDEESELGQAAAQSPEVVRALVDNHREFLAFLERRVGSRALAEDILQDAFVRGAREARRACASEESAVAWFYRVLRNAVIDHHRRRARPRTRARRVSRPSSSRQAGARR